jgi:hypothetical protein
MEIREGDYRSAFKRIVRHAVTDDWGAGARIQI